jgi:hypothetical protein
MALSNREKQQRWREHHIHRRRIVQRIASLLLRQTLQAEHFEALGALLRSLMTQAAIADLRRALKPSTKDEMEARDRADEVAWRDMWLREHSGRTKADYNWLLAVDGAGGIWAWREAKGRAGNDADRRAWEAAHPGEQYPEHLCGLTDREYTDYMRWQRHLGRRQNAGSVTG